MIRLAEAAGVPVYIVHLSARDALDEVRHARDRGAMAFAETCPQYLFLSLDDLGDGFDGAKFVCSPPLRTADHQDELWTGLLKDDLQVVSTDHCPFDFHGQKELGRGDFRKVPNGLPGVEDRVDLLHDGGVAAGRISRERWVDVISTAPAQMFGMYPRKGTISVGADADLVIYDPNATRTITSRRTTWTSTTRATRVARFGAAPTWSCRAVRSSSATARSPARPVTVGSSSAGSRTSPARTRRQARRGLADFARQNQASNAPGMRGIGPVESSTFVRARLLLAGGSRVGHATGDGECQPAAEDDRE